MSGGSEGRKWSCEYCTYENWPQAKKCTLCRAPKPPQFIHDEAPNIFDQDIYKIAPLICHSESEPVSSGGSSPSPSSPSGSHSSLDPNTNKWACQMCTYLNWPKATKCTQCLTVRPKPVAVIQPPSVTQPLSISVNIAQPAVISGGGSSAAARRISPRTSPSSPEAAKALNNDKNKAVVAASKHNKWTCKVCTYDNWPRSLKCVLCGVGRGKTQKDTADSLTTSGSGSDSEERRAGSAVRHSPPCSSRSTPEGKEPSPSIHTLLGATASPAATTSLQQQDRLLASSQDNNVRHKTEGRKLRQIRNRLREVDWLWLNACQGVVDGDIHAVEAYLASGGDPSRQLTSDEFKLLSRPSAFQVGYSLVHLAVRFQREDMLAALLTATDMVSKARKRVPSHAAPDLAADILREISSSIRQRKGDFPCYFITDTATFALPAEIEDLPNPLKKQLFDELLDQDVQKELEDEEPVINWSLELTERLGSRLYALWNRTAGDCLLDSVLQASWGVMDRDNTLRRTLADSLCEGTCMFYPRWKEWESLEAQSMHFSLDENQWHKDWAILLSIASQPGASLEQIHVFALAHILRRPIVIYGIKYVKSFRGENLGLAKFQGVYLPLLWEQSFCWRTPLALGYTRGHFCALVPMEVDLYEGAGARANLEKQEETQTAYLPLMDCQGKLLPIHFMQPAEAGREEVMLREWMDCMVTEGGLLVARQRLPKPSTQVRHMLDDWLDRYRRLAHVMQAASKTPPTQTTAPATQDSPHELSSDEETDDE